MNELVNGISTKPFRETFPRNLSTEWMNEWVNLKNQSQKPAGMQWWEPFHRENQTKLLHQMSIERVSWVFFVYKIVRQFVLAFSAMSNRSAEDPATALPNSAARRTPHCLCQNTTYPSFLSTWYRAFSSFSVMVLCFFAILSVPGFSVIIRFSFPGFGSGTLQTRVRASPSFPSDTSEKPWVRKMKKRSNFPQILIVYLASGECKKNEI